MFLWYNLIEVIMMDELLDYLPVMDEKREEKIYESFGKWWFGDYQSIKSEDNDEK